MRKLISFAIDKLSIFILSVYSFSASLQVLVGSLLYKGVPDNLEKSKRFSVHPLNLLDLKTPSNCVKMDENCEMSIALKND